MCPKEEEEERERTDDDDDDFDDSSRSRFFEEAGGDSKSGPLPNGGREKGEGENINLGPFGGGKQSAVNDRK